MKLESYSPSPLNFVAPTGGVTSGVAVLLGALLVIPNVTAAATVVFSGETQGAFRLPKLSTAVFTAGAKVAWDNTNKYFNVPGSGLYTAGVAVEAAGNGDTTVLVRLDGIGLTVTP